MNYCSPRYWPNVDFHLIKVSSDELVILKERQRKIAEIWIHVTFSILRGMTSGSHLVTDLKLILHLLIVTQHESQCNCELLLICQRLIYVNLCSHSLEVFFQYPLESAVSIICAI